MLISEAQTKLQLDFKKFVNNYSIYHHCVLTVILLTYDDIRLAGASTGVCCEVALDLVSSLIEQVQVVFHWVSIMKALAQTDDTWWRENTGMVDSLFSGAC